jgi:hypothetical protein
MNGIQKTAGGHSLNEWDSPISRWECNQFSPMTFTENVTFYDCSRSVDECNQFFTMTFTENVTFYDCSHRRCNQFLQYMLRLL